MLLISLLLSSISFAEKTVASKVATVGDSDLYITVQDFKSLQIYFLVIALTSVVQVGKFLFGLFSKKEQDRDARIDKIEDSQNEILQELKTMNLKLAQVKDAQLTETQIRNISRDEVNYIEKVRRRISD